MRSLFTLLLLVSLARPAWSSEPEPRRWSEAAARGFHLLLTKAYLPPDFNQQTFDQVWQVWPQPLRGEAEKASVKERRRMAYRRYGLVARPDDPDERPLQYVVDEEGNWSMNCLACHQGTVAGKIIPGVPNSHFALATLTEEIRLTKLWRGERLAGMQVGSLFVPLGTSNGTTNAVMFGVVLMNYRDAELNVRPNRAAPKLTNHDHDAPAWWHLRRKQRLYIDGFAQKSHRALMPFLMVEQNGPAKFREWEADFHDILAYIESLEPPKYPFAVDRALADQGERVFGRACAECHGTYGAGGKYPERNVAIEQVETDPVRHLALSVKHRLDYQASWFAHFGRQRVVEKPAGYVAPPLDGIWASAPYFHNGSVPTLWHLLHPDERPVVWRRTYDGYDQEKVGLEVSILQRIPDDVKRNAQRRTYFDTRVIGKSAAGHEFPSALSAGERRAVLEYLKTL